MAKKERKRECEREKENFITYMFHVIYLRLNQNRIKQ